ncbi:hypothetical protein O6H91_10G014900 [Diphasiastrum complanatum]|uniref:Uncharacterized protein n=1 Tax=Diphasiastrum complanatum TaxID=34168 RepID=A0ACC2CER4_DIPCM|nr:hypothetical protein O6H91_10G014900 [Diphasiastrum complanatum]
MYCCNRRGAVKGIVGFVILFNACQLCYFVSRSWPLSGRAPEPTIQSTGFSFHQGKPWPAIPSFRPWLADPELAPLSSCEAYFGNGFTRVYSLLEFEKEKADDQLGPGSFQCHFSETLQTSICEGKQVVMNPQNITMTKGGESLESVVHRSEEDELPTYSEGAFQIISEHKTSGKLVDQEMLDNFMPGGQVRPHRIRMLLESMQVIQKSEAVCSEIAGPTLFVTRYEYANLFHTVTDWYSAYASSRVIGLKQRPRVVLLDGHCKSALEDGWEVLFSGVEYAKHFSGSVCFEHAIFAPLGYNTALFEALGSSLPCQGCSVTELEEKFDSSKTARLREFGEVFTAAFDVPNFLPDGAHQNESGKRELKLLFIRRENYMAHPRHSGKLEVRLSNEEELLTALQKWSADMSKDSNEAFNLIVVNGLFAHMTLAEQIRAVQASSIIIGAHGAGLTHIIFSKPGTVVFEMLSPLYMRPHYRFISQWLGSDYHYLVTRGSSVNCSQVVASLSMIVPDLVKQTDMIV